MDEFKNLNNNDEFANNTPDANKMKVDFDNIESTESGISLEERFGTAQEFDDFKPKMAETKSASDFSDEKTVLMNEAPQAQPVQQFPTQQAETQKAPKKKSKKKADPESKKANSAKTKKNFGIFIRVFVITILSVATLWTVAYTIDHVLAAQGYSPVFVIEETSYDIGYLSDENAILEANNQEPMRATSYECLGYKIQHVYDEACYPKVDFIWAWEKGAVDELYDRGELFALTETETE